MSIKNLNIFRRLNELETDNLYLRTLLKSTRAELATLRDAVEILHNWVRPKPKAKPGPKAVRTKEALEKTAEKKREYARRYYAKKKAAKAAAT